ncbi:MAG: STAS domain-containing protein, partial [Fuerstiella sp.]|nr:STAS domain-containing protein [Fuerstiella sp.]
DDEELSLAALDHGAADYLVKSEVNAAWLAKSLIYAIQRNRPAPVIDDVADSADGTNADTVAEPEEVDTRPSHETDQSPESPGKWIVTPSEERLVKAKDLEQIKSSLLNLLHHTDCNEAHVDLSHVEYLGNAAIGMLLSVHQQSAAADIRLVLCGMKPQVREQLTSRRFDKVFDIQHS